MFPKRFRRLISPPPAKAKLRGKSLATAGGPLMPGWWDIRYADSYHLWVGSGFGSRENRDGKGRESLEADVRAASLACLTFRVAEGGHRFSPQIILRNLNKFRTAPCGNNSFLVLFTQFTSTRTATTDQEHSATPHRYLDLWFLGESRLAWVCFTRSRFPYNTD